MKLRQALKIYNRVDTPRQRPWRDGTVGAALRRYQKTDTSKDVNVYWDYLMRLRRRQLAEDDEAHPYDDDYASNALR